MDRPTAIPLRVGDWCVNPVAGQISRGDEIVRLEARTMRLLLCLAGRTGEVVSIEQLLDQVWAGVVVTPDSVYQAVAALRRLLGDDAKQPAYIATVPRLGYRLVAAVSAWDEELAVPVPQSSPRSGTLTTRRRAPGLIAATVVAALCIGLAAAFLFYRTPIIGNHATARAPEKSLAVLPFLDLTTQEMNEEYFADGMTEELIDRLSKIPGLRVPAPTSSFYFKGKQINLADVARSLRVAYVLDGSVRKSDATLRIAARLVRADDGYVVWSETYDRPSDDRLKVQADIAAEVTKALSASFN
jgi:transcriptional activator of cad operon